MPVAPVSSADLLDLLKKSGIVSPERLAGLSDLTLPDDPRKAAEVLVGQKVLTRFQAQQLLAGRHKGFRIGAYAILELLGRGGMGAVYLAEHLELHRKVAIKVLVPGKGEDQKLALERFLREARSAAALDHPNIVHIFDVARYNDVPYLVMEYVEGDTLQQIIDKGGPVPYPTATEYVAQAAAGLQHAHEKGFTHRDIKPGNLMRDKTGTVKILDMGLARSTSAADRLTAQLDGDAIVGTADFIAPEQAMNQPTVDVRADIYSLGATYFALITGKPPFDGNTAQKLLQHQLKNAPTLLSVDPTVPPGLSEVVAQMLAKKPEDRFQTPAEVIAALTPWMGNSAKILAGISRTNLGQSVELQAALAGIALSGSSKKLTGSKPGTTSVHDSAEVDPLEAMKETGAVAAAVTTRERTRPAESPKPLSRKTLALYAVLGVAVLVAGGVAGWLALGNKKEPEPQQPENRPQTNPDPKRDQKTDPKTNGTTPIPGDKVLFQLDLTGQQPFTVRSGLTVDPNDATRKSYRLISKSGAEPPAGWQARSWQPAGEMEYFSDDVGGQPTLGIRNVQGPPSAMLFSPLFTCPTGACRLKFEYQAPMHDKKFALKFKPNDNRQAWNLVYPPVTGDTWRTEDLTIDLKGATGGFFEFHNTDDKPDAPLRLRSMIVTEVKAGTPPTPPKPSDTDPSTWAEGPTLFTLDVASIPEFRIQKEQFTRLGGEAEMLPAGIGCQCWKPKAVGEFRCEKVDDVPALWVTNLNEEMSGQWFFQLEGGMKLPLEPGKAYRVKIGYLTKNEATGTAAVQVTPGFKGIASATLPGTQGKWKTATMTFVRPPAEDKVEVRMTIDNRSVGEGNMLCIRSLEIVELVPPGKK